MQVIPKILVFAGSLRSGAFSISTADAHPGHGSPAAQDGLWHYVTSPVHAGPAVLAAVIVLVAAGRAIRWRNRNRN